MKQKLKKWFYTAVMLCMSVSCKDTSPCIKDQCCFSGSNSNLEYVKSVNGARADLSSRSGVFIEGVERIKGESFLICPNSASIVANLPISYMDTLNEPHYYKYRIWGKLLECIDCQSQTAQKPWVINIDKIEKVN